MSDQYRIGKIVTKHLDEMRADILDLGTLNDLTDDDKAEIVTWVHRWLAELVFGVVPVSGDVAARGDGWFAQAVAQGLRDAQDRRDRNSSTDGDPGASGPPGQLRVDFEK